MTNSPYDMKIVICPDSFKGSLTSGEAADAIARGFRIGAGEGDIEFVKLPLADGGEGTAEALVRATGGEMREVIVHNPHGREIKSSYGILGDGKTAVVEMAAASGIGLLEESERDPLITATVGVGELLAAAAESGVEKMIVGIGGSATNDAGTGAMAVLGARFLDKGGHGLSLGGGSLVDLDRIDMSGFQFPKDKIQVTVACDVTNPLFGPTGAAAVYGPQKGATPQIIEQLDAGLRQWAEVVKRDLGKDVADMPGAGAAGGLGAGLCAFLGAELKSGIDIVLDAVGFDEVISGAELVVTGEGRLDEQTARGKTVVGILKRTQQAKVPLVALVGSCSGDISSLYDAGLTACFSLTPGPMSADYAMKHASELLTSVAANVARLTVRGNA